MAVKTILRGGGSMTRVDLTKAQCAELANYLRGVLNNGMGARSFDKIEMLVLARRALAAAEELPEVPRTVAHGPDTRKPQPEDASTAGSSASAAAQLKRGAAGADAEPGALPGGDLAGGGRCVGQDEVEEGSGYGW